MMNDDQESGRDVTPRRSFVERVIGAALLRPYIYEEVEADTSATPAAAGIVVVASISGGIGALATTGVAGLVAGIIIGLAGWVIWAYVTYFIGTRILSTPATHADWGQLARTLGFARAPVLLTGVASVPGIAVVGGLITFVLGVWSLVAMVIAVRTALDYESTGRAVGVVLLGFIPYLIFIIIVLSITAAIFGAETLGIELPEATPAE